MTKTKKTERHQLVKEVAQLTALVKTQAAALEIAQAQFKSYSVHHMRKGTEESHKKAVVNDQLAAAMGLALAGSMNWPTRYQETRAWEALKALANWPGVPDELKALAVHAVAEIGQGREPTVTTEATALGGSACPSQLVREYLEERGEFSALSTWHLYDLAAYAFEKFRARMRAARPANGFHSGGYVRDVPLGAVVVSNAFLNAARAAGGGEITQDALDELARTVRADMIALQPPEAILNRDAALNVQPVVIHLDPAHANGLPPSVAVQMIREAQGVHLEPPKVTLKPLDGGKAKN